MKTWDSHLMCEGCWNVAHPGRVPVMVEDAPEGNARLPCCYCDAETRSGIYVRAKSADLRCEGRGPNHEAEAEAAALPLPRCPCGYSHDDVALETREAFLRMTEGLPETVDVRLEGGAGWAVPRVFIALHGLSGPEIKLLAARYGWQKLETRRP